MNEKFFKNGTLYYPTCPGLACGDVIAMIARTKANLKGAFIRIEGGNVVKKKQITFVDCEGNQS